MNPESVVDEVLEYDWGGLKPGRHHVLLVLLEPGRQSGPVFITYSHVGVGLCEELRSGHVGQRFADQGDRVLKGNVFYRTQKHRETS